MSWHQTQLLHSGFLLLQRFLPLLQAATESLKQGDNYMGLNKARAA
jgi:hypothetical protein